MKLKIIVVERENETVWGEKEIERETIITVDGKAETYSLRFVEYLRNGKWLNRSIGYSIGEQNKELKGKIILSKCFNFGG